METWRSLEKLQQIMLLALAAMFVVFTILYPLLNARKGVANRGTLLLRTQAGENAVYTGQIREQKAVFHVSPGGCRGVF